ncbi:MAG: Asp-tRNA(Asn)/Glu-tRNA(Gln) amidotransferase subunit GatA [Deferribacteraceae bacterium]|jgi:aspartyl-tRNA(Asn)/glutamyl-tRNA(Gln) amidotransferase subunit A|nr:Asp-tRNA(Asn)/Glu-tRNA(Gln) amidotransferase subunit GatA [Deferribacteraceae bacterium]
MDIINLSLPALKKALDDKVLSSLELLEHYLKRIDKYDPQVKAYLHVNTEAARAESKRYDDKRAKGETVPSCAGIPVGLKDLLVTQDMPTTCASKMLEGYYSPFDATVVKNMKALGYIMLGKLNMDQFAMGSSGETSYYQKTCNPWDLSRVPGGSSSGSAAAMAARLAPITIGSDTGGSIRQPAGFCGVTGFKPTYGRVSRYGAVGYASSLDQVGPIAKSAEDVAFIMDALAGRDPLDPTSIVEKPASYVGNLSADLRGMKLGLPDTYLTEHVAPKVKEAVLAALEVYKKLGAEIIDIKMHNVDFGIAVYQIIANAEASSNLAKFDGIEFGHRADTTVLEEVYSSSRGEGFGSEVKKRLILGTYMLQKEQYEEYYVRAMKLRSLIRQEYDKAFSQCDAIIGPTSSTAAFTFGANRSAFEMYLNDLYTVLLNLNGSCGISIPCGFDEFGMPIGLQLQGDMFADQKVLNIAHAFQQATDYHKALPALIEGGL